MEEIRKSQQEIADSKLSSYQLQERELRETYERQLAVYQKHGEDTRELTEKFQAEYEELRRTEQTRIDREREQREEQEREAEMQKREARLAGLEAAYEEQLEQERIFLERLELQRQEAELNGDQKTLEEIQQQIADARQQQELANLEFQENYRILLEELLADEAVVGQERVELQKKLQQQKNDLLKAGLQQRKAAKDKEVEEEQQRKEKLKKLEEAYLDNSVSLMNQSAQLLGESTAAGKAMSLAGATIDAYRAGSAALASVPFPANIVAMASTIATGLSTVKSILSTSIPGASDTTSSSAIPSAVENVSVPEPEIADLYQSPIEQVVTQLASTEEQSLNQPSRVYVVETDISDTMTKVQVAETESNF